MSSHASPRRIVYLGPVSPHWEVYGDCGDRTVLEEFRPACSPASCCCPATIRSSGATASASCAMPSARRISLEWDLGLPRRSDPIGIRGASWQAPMDDRFINRELSWLDFNDGALSWPERGIPLLERPKFVAI